MAGLKTAGSVSGVEFGEAAGLLALGRRSVRSKWNSPPSPLGVNVAACVESAAFFATGCKPAGVNDGESTLRDFFGLEDNRVVSWVVLIRAAGLLKKSAGLVCQELVKRVTIQHRGQNPVRPWSVGLAMPFLLRGEAPGGDRDALCLGGIGAALVRIVAEGAALVFVSAVAIDDNVPARSILILW